MSDCSGARPPRPPCSTLVLAPVMFAPGLAPGRTLSASDILLVSAVPWDAARPAHLTRSARTSTSRTRPPVPARPAGGHAPALPDIPALGSLNTLGGRPFLGGSRSRRLLAVQRCPSYVLPSGSRWPRRRCSSCSSRSLGRVPARSRARNALRRCAMAGLVLRASASGTVSWVSWPHDERLGLPAVAAAWCERLVRRPAPLGSPCWRAWSGSSSSAATPRRASRCCSSWSRSGRARAGLTGAAAAGGAAPFSRCGGAGRRRRRSPPWRSSPFTELLMHSDATSPSARAPARKQLDPTSLLGAVPTPTTGGTAARHSSCAVFSGARVVRRRAAADAGRRGARSCPSAVRIAVAAVGAVTLLAVASGVPPFVYDRVPAAGLRASANNDRLSRDRGALPSPCWRAGGSTS